MGVLTHVAAFAGLVGVEALIAALILMPGVLRRRAHRMLHAAIEHVAAAAARARDRIRRVLRPRGPRFRPPRFA
jgi:hypothetical protein